MREILFRGKRLNVGLFSVTTSNKWVYGYYVKDAISTYIYSSFDNPKMVSVDFKTVGQYTGLTDKNGTKIFEGDIIQFLNHDNEIGRKGIVYWDSGAFWIDCTETEGDEGICLLNAAPTKLCAIVIGNIHDNPELMEASNE